MAEYKIYCLDGRARSSAPEYIEDASDDAALALLHSGQLSVRWKATAAG
jgi:hypothetical protein